MNLTYLRAERLKKGFTMKEMAEKLDIAYVTYRYIETGKRSVSLNTLVKIANTLKLDTNKLLNIKH